MPSRQARMRTWMEQAYPVCRSITGDGVRRTLDLVAAASNVVSNGDRISGKQIIHGIFHIIIGAANAGRVGAGGWSRGRSSIEEYRSSECGLGCYSGANASRAALLRGR